MKKFILLALVLMVAAVGFASAVQQDQPQVLNTQQFSVQTGRDDTSIQTSGTTNIAFNHANIHVYSQINAVSSDTTTTNNFYAQESNGVYNLDTGVIEVDRVLISGQVLQLAIPQYGKNATVFYITSGTPIAVYTLDNGVDTDSLQGSQSKMMYDPIYDVMKHGNLNPVDIVPYYTTKCSIVPSQGATSIVLDNRYYPEDAVTQIRFYDSGVPLSQVTPTGATLYGVTN